MKVVCIKKRPDLTIGKIYIILDKMYNDINNGVNPNSYLLIDDTKKKCWYNGDRFITLEEYREQQLNKIL